MKFEIFYLKSTSLCVAITFNNLLITGNPFDDLGIFLDLFFDFIHGNLLLVEGFGFDLSFALKSSNDILVLPSDIM